MNLREILKRIVHTFFLIWSLSGLMVCIFALIFSWSVVRVDFILSLLLIAFLTSLTYIVYYSKNELTVRQLILRIIVQFFLVLGTVLAVSWYKGWLEPQYPFPTIAVVASVLIIFIIIISFELYQTWRLADKLNLKLQERFKE